MYNKLFTKILDSSIWLESIPTRIVWLTFIAVMDEDGYAQFASVANVAHRARVTPEEAEEAIRVLESPDSNSSNPAHDGRRLERVPGGWIVLNAKDHRDAVTRVVIKEQTRERVRRHRERKAGNANVTHHNEKLTPSVAVADTTSDTKADSPPAAGAARLPDIEPLSPTGIAVLLAAVPFQTAYANLRGQSRNPEGFDALLRAIHTPIAGGPAYPWPIIGAALMDLDATGGAVTPNAIRAFCRKLTEPEALRTNLGRKGGATGDGIDWDKPLPPEQVAL